MGPWQPAGMHSPALGPTLGPCASMCVAGEEDGRAPLAMPSQAVPCQLQELSGSLGLVMPALWLVPFPTANVPKSCLGAMGQGTLGFPPRPAAQWEQHSRGQSHDGSQPTPALHWAQGLGLLLAHARSWTGPECSAMRAGHPAASPCQSPGPCSVDMGLLLSSRSKGSSLVSRLCWVGAEALVQAAVVSISDNFTVAAM